MRVFLAGASGVIGTRLVPLLVDGGHEVAGMTRSAEKAEALRELGAEPVVVDVYDADRLRDAVVDFGAELVMHQLTDLPDASVRIPEFAAANSRIRTEGTRNLLAAAAAAGADRFLAQSIAWRLPGDAHARSTSTRRWSWPPAVSSSATDSSTAPAPTTRASPPNRLASASRPPPAAPSSCSMRPAASWQ